MGAAGGAAVSGARRSARRVGSREQLSASTAFESSEIVGRSTATTRGCSSPATTCLTSGSSSSVMPRRNVCTPCSAPPAGAAAGAAHRRHRRCTEATRSSSPAALGLRTTAEVHAVRPRVVGAGPAGLAAAVYARVGGAATSPSSNAMRPVGRPARAPDRELPRLPERARAGPICRIGRHPGPPARRRDGAGAQRGRALERARLDPRPALRRRHRDRGTTPSIVATGVSYRLLDRAGLAELTGRGRVLRRFGE